MPHQEDKADPWHQRRIDFGSDEVGTIGADHQGDETIPKIKKANKVEERDAWQSQSDSVGI
jgi:hypothetical protein